MSEDARLVISEEARVEQVSVGHVGEEGMGLVISEEARLVISEEASVVKTTCLLAGEASGLSRRRRGFCGAACRKHSFWKTR